MIDASIPFRAGSAGQFSLADLAQQSQQLRHGEQAMQQRERALNQQDQQFQLEMQQHTARLSAAEREAAAKGLEDMAAAVQWADTPEKWSVVQQHLAQGHPELAGVQFGEREQVLIQTGQMANYLKANQEKFQAIEPGGSLFGISPTGDVREVVRANPGTAAPMAPVGGGETRKTVGGKSYVNRNGQWFEETAASNGSGGFPGQ
jgi:hypothetical protein